MKYTKTLLKQLEIEGITEAILKSTNIHRNLNPVQLRKDENPVNLMPCGSGYWISLGNGIFLKDENNEFIVVSKEEAIIGKARFYLNFQEDALEIKIQKELSKLKNLVDEKLDSLVTSIKNALIYAGEIPNDSFAMGAILGLMAATDNPEHKILVDKAKKVVDEKTLPTYNLLKEQQDMGNDKNYDFLYDFFFQDGLPMIGEFKYNSTSDMNALVALFHRNALDHTMKTIEGKSHLYVIAKINVEKEKQGATQI